jgi:integrase
MIVLTPTYIDQIEPTDKRQEIADARQQGLRIVVQPKPSGAKSWACRYTFKRDKFKLTLGPYPALGVGAAREAAREALQAVALGTNPAETKRLERATAEVEAKADAKADEPMTIETAVALYDDLHVSKLRPATMTYVRRELDTAKDAWRARLLTSIKRKDVIAFVDLADKRGPHAGNTRRKVLAAFFRWACEDRDLIEDSPAQLSKNEVKKRKRFLADDELRLVWLAADKLGGSYGALAKLLILTGCRRNEIAKLTWDEVKPDCIFLLPERTKTDESLRVPLTPLMRSILDALPRRGRYVLGNGRPMSANMRAKESLDVKLNEPWRFHDLRRSFITGCARIKIPVQVVEKCVNHALGGVLAVYQQHDFADEKREAFMKWSKHIAAITAPDAAPRSQDMSASPVTLAADLATA